jgi:hypothetical protein
MLLNSVQQLEEAIDNTEMTAESEAYQAALVFYKSVKMAAAQDIPGAKAVYKELKTRFPQRGGRREAGGPAETKYNPPDETGNRRDSKPRPFYAE